MFIIIQILKSCGSGKTNALLNIINNELDINKIYLYAKDPYKSWYQLLISKRESTGLKCCNDSKVFIEYSNDMYDIYKILKNTIQIKKEKYLSYLMIWFLICLLAIKNLIW